MQRINRKFIPNVPALDIKTKINSSPHVVILGAGASLAALPNGDRNGKKLPAMNNLIEVLKIDSIIAKHGEKYAGENFEDWYSQRVSRKSSEKLCNELEDFIEKYFEHMCLPDEPTIYDYLVLSLRNKDVIATFNWDPFLSQAFNRNKDAIGYENLPKLIYLHGNVTIGICYECKSKGWRYNQCLQCGNKFSSYKLLFPVKNKDYARDDFLFSEWSALQEYIKAAYFFTIFGYSAPKTDVEARRLIHQAWDKNASENHTVMSIIDVKSENEIMKNWNEFIVNDDPIIFNKSFFSSYLAAHPRRTCEAYAMASLQQQPWKENKFPRDISLKQLQNWTLQLIEEESAGVLKNKICVVE